MAEYRGLSGKLYRTQNVPFAGGGEGDIYDVIGASGYVAKIYKSDKRTKERERKLSVMVSNQPSVMEQYAWPLDVLYDNGQFVGYIMAKINGKEKLRNIYVYDKRKGNPWSLYIAIAKNLSAAVHNVHEIHQVVGDLNPENILVNPHDGMVTLVDTDSYHISDVSRTYRCGVGMPEFVAPELQGIHFPSAPLPTFTPESDRFALAVLIFALLMNGAHPFSCKVISGSSSKFQPIDNMQNGKCAFFSDIRSSNMDIPRYAPDISSLPENIQKLFRRAFVAGHRTPSLRPSAEEWYNALEQLEDNLKTCIKDTQHIYYYGAKECPWCKVNVKMHSISQSAFNSSSQSGSGTGSQQTTATGPAQQFIPSGYRYTPSSSSPGNQIVRGGIGKWVVMAFVAVILLIIVRSCSSQNDNSDVGDDKVVPATEVDITENISTTKTTIESGMEVEDNNTFSAANEVLLDARYTGSLSDTYSAGEQDWYKFVLDESGGIYINFYTKDQSNNNAYWDISVRSEIDPESDIWQKYVAGDETVTISEKLSLDAGTYYLEIESSSEHSTDSYEFMVERIIEKTSNYIHLSQLTSIDQDNDGDSFAYYDTVKDNFGTTYKNGIGGTDGYGQSIQEYRLDGTYSELRGRVVLNYDVRTQENDDVYLWIYGDNIVLYMSQEVKAGCEPQDFTVDLTGVTTLKVVIQGQSMLRLVDCGLYTDSSVPTVSTATLNNATTQERIYLSDLEWFNASSSGGGFRYYDSVKDNFNTTYANGIGGTDGYGQSFQEYRIDSVYSEMRGKVVLNYDVRTQTNDDVFLWVYGDNNLLFQSQAIMAGCEPQDFTVDLTGVTTLKVVIQGQSMLRLVDCILYK